ncbi:hypothetical protein TeGR_g3958 [Tetraparma gracilis]|uniref:Dynein regulatory complex subunit 3 n=1 Tax=Tetraparma gracilis TaxID=2962635 RepID=A0ABQ6MPF6_9STRA|nr:hypothetical protein TeGR_g3958 [Tetraparma gracilis]
MAPTDSDDINVIDEDLIQSSLVDLSADPSNTTQPLSALVSQATSLRLSFKNIKKIDNLQGFNNLTTLCLDNNVIDKIGQITHLTNLKWLDLSFNNISVIEGLEKLTQLTDLTLFNNKIEQIGGLDQCTELQCLSLGNNKIANLDVCQYLRKFRQLRLVNLEGNPVFKEAEYKMMLLAYLPNIKYLDYALIYESDVATAREQYQDELQEAEENEVVESEKAKRDAQAAALTALLEAANLGVIQTIFDDFFAEDTEHAKLQHLPSINEHVDTLRNSIDQLSETFKVAGLALQEAKDTEIAKFEAALGKMRSADAETSVGLIEDFSRQKKRVFREISTAENPDRSLALPLTEKLDDLYDKLMDLEMQQVQKFEEMLGDFEEEYMTLKGQCGELTQNYFKSLQEAEENYFNNVTALANELLEKAGKEELDMSTLSEEATNLLVDRDTLMASISGSHDIHVTKGFNAETQCEEREKTRFIKAVGGYQEDARERNRARIMEIYQYIQESKSDINKIIEEEAPDDDEYDDM